MKVHGYVNWQINILGLIVAFCDYGVDYYWLNRQHHLMTSSRSFILLKFKDDYLCLHLWCGIKYQDREFRLPDRWTQFWLNRARYESIEVGTEQ